MITDLASAIEFIRQNRPQEVLVSPDVLEAIRSEIGELHRVKSAPRPTYGPPYGDGDRQLWDEHQALMKVAPVYVFGAKLVSHRVPR